MAAEPERAVDDDRSRPLQGGGQQVQAPLEHHRDVSTGTQGALSDPAGRYAPPGPHPPPTDWGTPSERAPEASADREREEAEPYVRAAHAGRSPEESPVSPGKTVQQGVTPPAPRHFSPPCGTVNQPACASPLRVRQKSYGREKGSYGGTHTTLVG
ncbi:hypothetical protein GCM10010321_65590 [Streptomyces chartreusis]|nr:hypothetical protein GCM10010321_65590 [Streptomyces chartreusis]